MRNITSEFPAGEAAVLALASMSLPYQPALGREALEGAAKRLSVMAQEGDQRLQQASQRVGHALVLATQGEAFWYVASVSSACGLGSALSAARHLPQLLPAMPSPLMLAWCSCGCVCMWV